MKACFQEMQYSNWLYQTDYKLTLSFPWQFTNPNSLSVTVTQMYTCVYAHTHPRISIDVSLMSGPP